MYASIGATAALQVMLTYIPGLNWFFSMPEGMLGIQWARVIVCMIIVYLVVELEKVLVDPVLMPVVRPVLDFIADHSPSWLRNPKTLVPKALSRRKREQKKPEKN